MSYFTRQLDSITKIITLDTIAGSICIPETEKEIKNTKNEFLEFSNESANDYEILYNTNNGTNFIMRNKATKTVVFSVKCSCDWSNLTTDIITKRFWLDSTKTVVDTGNNYSVFEL